MRISWNRVSRHLLQVVAFCGVIAVITAAIWPRRGYPAQLGFALCIGMPTWAAIEFGRLLILRPGESGWPRGMRGVALSAAGIATGLLLGGRLGDALFGDGGRSSSHDALISWLLTIVAGVAAIYYFHTRSVSAQLSSRVSAAERDTAEARLKLLETQLEPHMLFNTLANLRALIATDPPRAIAMLDRLDSYLRVTLTGSRAQMHPLSAEFARLADYLALMQVRMGDRLRYALDLPAGLHELPVPPLLLQPLVENAIRHGLEPKVEGGEIRVRARRDGDTVRIEVRDTGAGLDAAAPTEGTGFGLAQVRERLAALYGARGALLLQAPPEGGTRAEVTLPWSAA